MKAINILWDVEPEFFDGEDIELPAEIALPDDIVSPDAISDYLTEQTGFLHNGFSVVPDEYEPLEKTRVVSSWLHFDDQRNGVTARAGVEFSNGMTVQVTDDVIEWLEDNGINIPFEDPDILDIAIEDNKRNFYKDVAQRVATKVSLELFNTSYCADAVELKEAIENAIDNEFLDESEVETAMNEERNEEKKELSVAERLSKHIKGRRNDTLYVSNDNYTAMYTFAKYGETRLVYGSYQHKQYEGEEFSPFQEANGAKDVKLVGVAFGEELLKITAMYDPLFNVDESLKIRSFEGQRDGFNEWIIGKVRERLHDDNAWVTLSNNEYLDYLAGKVDEKTLMANLESEIVLSTEDVTPWVETYVCRQLEKEGKVDGRVIAMSTLNVEGKDYSAYIVERDTDKGVVYDPCIENCGEIVSLDADSYRGIGYKTPREAQQRAERYFSDTVKTEYSRYHNSKTEIER